MAETQYVKVTTKHGKEEFIALTTGGVAAHNQAWSTITDRPTTLAGYGITDGGEGMTYPGTGIAVSTGAAWGPSIVDNSSYWNTAYIDRLKWDGGSTGLTPATGRTSLGGTTVGQNVFTLSNPSAISFLRMNADNSVSALSASDFKTALSLQNVTNESKATMFTNPTFTGTITHQGNTELFGFSYKVYGNYDSTNYYLGHYAVIDSDGFIIQWYGGIRLSTADGVGLQVLQGGNIIIGGTSGSQKLTVHGEIGIRYGNNIVHYDVSEAHYWLQVPHSTNEYYWSYDGTMKMKLVSDGTLYCKGDVIAYA